VSNAVKFADPASPCVGVDGQLIEGVGWRLGVRDNGAGVAEEDRARIFDAFERGVASDAEGYGLGLAICERLVRRHGGALGLDPGGDGRGARFWFVLPSATPVPTAGSPPPASSPPMRPPR
jgi:signal transduction histidine kinase